LRADHDGAGQDARRETAWLLLLLAGVLCNAIISGAFSEPHARYGARVIWLLPMAAALLAAAHRPWRVAMPGLREARAGE
jgi:hypothetical protein